MVLQRNTAPQQRRGFIIASCAQSLASSRAVVAAGGHCAAAGILAEVAARAEAAERAQAALADEL